MSRKGRDPIDRELQGWRERVAVIDKGLLACYETIAEGNRQKAGLEAKIKARVAGERMSETQAPADGDSNGR